MRLVHISDLHFGAVNPNLPEALRNAIMTAKPEVLVISGDLTQRGRIQEFQEAKAFLDSIPLPQLVVPGNHDVQGSWTFWDRFIRPFSRYRRIIDRTMEPVWCSPGLFMVGTNSARPAGWYLDWSRGRLSRYQMARLVSLGSEADPNALRVLVVHHPPAAPPGGTPRHLIGRLREFSEAVNHAGIDLVLSGHFHISYAQALELKGDPDTRSCVLSSVSTATSHRLKGEPNGFHIIDGDAKNLLIQDWAWNGKNYQERRTWKFQSEADRDWHIA
jgi:3',5'-cyclic AMP phosphodiesterase CpdA